MKSVIVLAASAVAWLACGFPIQTVHAQVPPGYCLFFTNSSAQVTVPHDAKFNAYPLTLTAWVQADLQNQSFSILQRVEPGQGGYWMSFTNGQVYARYVQDSKGANTDLLKTGVPFIADVRWHHLAFVVAPTPRLYVDGHERMSGSWSGQPGACAITNALIIGGQSSLPRRGPLIDEATLWNRELSQGEIQALMATPANGPTNGLVASWQFNEGSGSAAADSSRNRHVGTLEGGPGWILLAPPAVTTTMASYHGSTNAAVFGSVNPRTVPGKAWFEWGTNLAYGRTSAVMDAISDRIALPDVVVSAAISPVSFGTIHYRAAASNSFGRAVGADRTFDTTRLSVTTLADNESGSLRYVLSNALPGTTISFHPGLSGTISLVSGELVLDRNVIIVGPGADRVAVSGSLTSRVFSVLADVTAHVSGLTIRDGRTPGGIGYSDSVHGGGIYSRGHLTLDDCVITNNATGRGSAGTSQATAGFSGSGGGICNVGTLVMTGCAVSGNATGEGGPGRAGSSSSVHGGDGGDSGYGGGIYNGGTLELYACTISSNAVGAAGDGGAGYVLSGGYGGDGGDGGNGGGIFRYSGRLALENCTISGNRSGTGGAGGMDGRLFPPFTFGESGTVGRGGGLYSSGQSYSLLLRSCTITSNAPGSGGRNRVGASGGIYASASRPSLLVNTLIAGNAGFSNTTDVAGSFVSGGHNLIGNGEGSVGLTNGIFNDQVGSALAPLDPRLGPLAHNGGTNCTHALLPGSPAIDAGSRFGVPLTDQRGLRRVVCCASDIGAFEVQECSACLAPVITSMALDSNQTRWLQGNGEPGANYTLQVSTNLTHWSDLGPLTADPIGLFEYGDPAAGLGSQRFYRLRQP